MALALVHTLSHGSSAHRPLWVSAVRSLDALVAYARRELAILRARRELNALPDEMLIDMGISRSEITSVVRYGASDSTRLPRGTV